MLESYMVDLIPQLQAQFPLVPERILKRIVIHGSGQMHEHIAQGEEILLMGTSSVKMKLLIFEPDTDIKAAIAARKERRMKAEQRRRMYTTAYNNPPRDRDQATKERKGNGLPPC